MSIRDLRARARGHLHAAMQVPAIYIAPDDTETACNVRVHDRTTRFGDMTGFDYQPVERIEQTPQVVALVSEITPARGGTFSVAAGEAYKVEVVNPPDGITVTCEVTRLSAAKAAGLTVPD